MIIKFKLFEHIHENKPDVGDYVICDEQNCFDKIAIEFIKNNIGVCIKIKRKPGEPELFLIKFLNSAPDLCYFKNDKKGNSRYFYLEEIVFWSKDKEDVETYIVAKNFNL